MGFDDKKSFDENVNRLKKEFRQKRLSPEKMIEKNERLAERLEKEIASRRLRYEFEFDEEDGPRVSIRYADANFHIGDVFVGSDGSCVFMSQSEYFPPLAPFDNEEKFIRGAREFLSEGLAAFELDEEEDAWEA